MVRIKIGLGLLVIAGAITPVYANWFDAFEVGPGHKRQIGSAASPTPDDLRAIGDSNSGAGKSYRFDPKSGHFHEVKDSAKTDDPVRASDAVMPVSGAIHDTPAPIPAAE